MDKNHPSLRRGFRFQEEGGSILLNGTRLDKKLFVVLCVDLPVLFEEDLSDFLRKAMSRSLGDALDEDEEIGKGFDLVGDDIRDLLHSDGVELKSSPLEFEVFVVGVPFLSDPFLANAEVHETVEFRAVVLVDDVAISGFE